MAKAEPDPLAALERALAAIGEREQTLHAWAHLDPDLARARARETPGGPLRGLTLGVKDIFDTAELPTEHGTSIYAGNRPRCDAAAVALLLGAGAVLVGKTVTTELAWFTPGPTTNPHRASHTPGGSSSGSAAAVAAGTIDLALGTQTAGSIIRPASFCGAFGYKPTFGLAPGAGVKQAAPSLDTVGLFAADLDVLDRARAVLTSRPGARRDDVVRFALVRGEHWDDLTPDGREVVEEAAARVGAQQRGLPDALVGLGADQELVQAFEGARALAFERAHHADELSLGLREILDAGAAIDPVDHDRAQHHAQLARHPDALDALFGEADVLLTPAVLGEAPAGLASTGDPRCCRAWTLLGFPTLSVPGLDGTTGLPIGVQLVARPRDDARLVAAGAVLSRALTT